MKILHISTSDIAGGAARAAFRLHRGLIDYHDGSKMIVQFKTSDDCHIYGPKSNILTSFNSIRPAIDHIPKIFYPRSSKNFFHLQWLPNRVSHILKRLKPDIIHLHFICRGFMSVNSLTYFKRPIVWTLHDMWPFTGGCHYSGTCTRYRKLCGFCPVLNSKIGYDLSRWTIKRKLSSWSNLPINIVSPSQWIHSKSSQSALFKYLPNKVIPNGIDTTIYRPFDRQTARSIFGLPQDKTLIAFGAMNAISDKRKGYLSLIHCLEIIKNSLGHKSKKYELIIFGTSKPDDLPTFGIKIHFIGKLHDDISLALLYSSADIFVLPSYEDNLPNTIMEAMACGIPCVAFNVGGLPDLIDHKINGFLADAGSIESLANGIKWVLKDRNRHRSLSAKSVKKVRSDFDIQVVSQYHVNLYKEILRQQHS